MSSWARALKNVIRQDDAEYKKAKRSFDVYNFPDPGLFLYTQNEVNGVRYMKNWLHSRYTWLWRASRADHTPQPLSSQLWRECLFHGFANGTKTAIGDKSFVRIQGMLKTFGCSLNAHGFLEVDSEGPSQGNIEMAEDVELELEWNEKALCWKNDEFLMDGTVQEILWELYELNFRTDLLSLDKHLAPSSYKNAEDVFHRQELLAKCFYGGDDLEFDWLRLQVASANKGLAGRTIRDRQPYITNLARAMLDWKVSIPSKITRHINRLDVTDDDLYDLEEGVASLYCQEFYNYRGRAPLTPHRAKAVI
jgi:hypothetical protein